jgi:hypothetical protein
LFVIAHNGKLLHWVVNYRAELLIKPLVGGKTVNLPVLQKIILSEVMVFIPNIQK